MIIFRENGMELIKISNLYSHIQINLTIHIYDREKWYTEARDTYE